MSSPRPWPPLRGPPSPSPVGPTDRLEATARVIGQSGGHALALLADVTDQEAMDRLVGRTEEHAAHPVGVARQREQPE